MEGMKCRVCGAELEDRTMDLPFNVANQSTVVINDIPVLACPQCPEIELTDVVMARVETLLKRVHEGTRLEVIQYAA